MTLDELIDLARTCRHGEFSALASQSDILAVLTEVRDALSRRPAATSEAVAGDYVLVPREPTEAMLDAAWWNGPDVERIAATRSPRDRAKLMYRAMLAAAPASPDRQTRGVQAPPLAEHHRALDAAADALASIYHGDDADVAPFHAMAHKAVGAYFDALKAPTLPVVEKEQDGWTQERIGAWADTVFGPVTDLPRAVKRADEEMRELLTEAEETADPDRMIVEMADVVIVLKRIAHVIGRNLDQAISAKMDINEAREWRSDGTGHGYHVPPTQSGDAK